MKSSTAMGRMNKVSSIDHCNEESLFKLENNDLNIRQLLGLKSVAHFIKFRR